MRHYLPRILRRVLPALFLAAMSPWLSGCSVGFTMNGSMLNYDIYKTIYISEFPIRAALVYPPLQQTFENKLLDGVARQTRLNVVSNPNSDLEMSGEITGYSLSPQAVGCLRHSDTPDHNGTCEVCGPQERGKLYRPVIFSIQGLPQFRDADRCAGPAM